MWRSEVTCARAQRLLSMDPDSGALARHLVECDACGRLVRELAAADAALRTAGAAAPDPGDLLPAFRMQLAAQNAPRRPAWYMQTAWVGAAAALTAMAWLAWPKAQHAASPSPVNVADAVVAAPAMTGTELVTAGSDLLASRNAPPPAVVTGRPAVQHRSHGSARQETPPAAPAMAQKQPVMVAVASPASVTDFVVHDDVRGFTGTARVVAEQAAGGSVLHVDESDNAVGEGSSQ